MFIGLHVNTGYSRQILMRPEFSLLFFKKIREYKKVMKVRTVGAELFHADRRTDKVVRRFSQFCRRA